MVALNFDNTTITATQPPKAFEMSIADLQKRSIWVNWSKDTTADGKTTKVLKNSKTGGNAMTNTPATWSSYATADNARSRFDGVGLCFTDLGGGYALCGIDIDGHNTGKNEFANSIMQMFNGTYAEHSPSGTGYHLLFAVRIADIPKTADGKKLDDKYYQKNPKNELECYVAGLTSRYFTFTGNRVSDSDTITDKTDTLLAFLDKYMLKPVPSKHISTQSLSFAPAPATVSYDWLNVARTAKNGAKFAALYDKGDISGFDNDDSKADIALCAILAFYLQGDPQAIDTAFRSSALMRDKWLRDDYRNSTINKALSQVGNTYYKPPKAKAPIAAPNTPVAPAKNTKDHLIFEEFLRENGLIVRYNVITHNIDYIGFDPAVDKTFLPDIATTQITEMIENSPNYETISEARVIKNLQWVAAKNHYNPVLDMISGCKWDGVDRIQQIYTMFQIDEDDTLSRSLIRKWLMQAYCGLHNSLDNPFSLDIVLVFQGSQGTAKTRFFEWLAMLSCLFGEAVCLDPRNKDSVIQSISVWLCELGEIDATMKKDIPALKGFLTTAVDKYRPPYGRNELAFARRTSFVGTVNDPEFLVDPTGNRRFATVPLKPTVRLDVTTQIHTFDALQLWAQVEQIVNDELANGKTYANCFRLTADELQQLDERNANHTKPMKGEVEVKDVLYKNLNPESGYETVEEWITVSRFISDNDELQRYSAADIGKVLEKLGYPATKRKINGTSTQVRKLPIKRSINASNHGIY